MLDAPSPRLGRSLGLDALALPLRPTNTRTITLKAAAIGASRGLDLSGLT